MRGCRSLPSETALKAGTLLYYREGAAATVSVKRRTGAFAGDRRQGRCLERRRHADAEGAGAPAAAACTRTRERSGHHRTRQRRDAGVGPRPSDLQSRTSSRSRRKSWKRREFFAANNDALGDPRTRLIVGDGRSHLRCRRTKYDVIISEPSNPWMAGVAALFTREFFATARDRLAARRDRLSVGAHLRHQRDGPAIDRRDLRVGLSERNDVAGRRRRSCCWSASADPMEPLLANIERGWSNPPVAADLRAVGAADPFELLSLFAGGAQELGAMAATSHSRPTTGWRSSSPGRARSTMQGPRWTIRAS